MARGYTPASSAPERFQTWAREPHSIFAELIHAPAPDGRLKPRAALRVVVDVTRSALLIGLYMAAGIAFLVIVNADPNHFTVPFLVVVAAAIALGWGTGDLGRRGVLLWVLLPWITVLLALPFGDASKVLTGGDDIYPVWFYAAWPALAAMVAMLLAAGARNLYERHRRSAPPTAA
jgi:hypothetical protein